MTFEDYQAKLDARNDILPLGTEDTLQFKGETLEFEGSYFTKGIGRNDAILKFSGDGLEVHYSPVTNQLKVVRGTDVSRVEIDGVTESGEVRVCRK